MTLTVDLFDDTGTPLMTTECREYTVCPDGEIRDYAFSFPHFPAGQVAAGFIMRGRTDYGLVVAVYSFATPIVGEGVRLEFEQGRLQSDRDATYMTEADPLPSPSFKKTTHQWLERLLNRLDES